MKPKLSVIVPVYNVEKYLRQCMDSLVNQTLKEIEIICLNDGSTDNSSKLLENYKQKDNRIAIVSTEHKNAGAARNIGMGMAKGEYLAFLDSDDFFEYDMLELLYNTAKNASADVCVIRPDEFDIQTKEFRHCPLSFCTEYFEVGIPFCPQTFPNNENIFRMFRGWAFDKIFKREFILNEKIGFQEIRSTNDMLFVFMALVKSERIVTLDKILVHHRVNIPTSLENTREKSWDSFYIALKALYDELKKSNLYETYRKAFLNWTVNFSLWHLNTLFGTEAYCNIYNLLRGKAFEEFEITKAGEKDFYNLDEYRQFKDIQANTLEKSLMKKKVRDFVLFIPKKLIKLR